jgi:hypothetical protein
MNKLEAQRLHYPRISDIIGKQTEKEMRHIPIEYLVTASIRGTKVHDYCTAYLRQLWLPEIEEEYIPYVNAFIEWSKDNIYQTLYNNVRLYDDVKRFTGEFDLICILNPNKDRPIRCTALIDIKTSAKACKDWPVKMAAYKHLCEINGIEVDMIYNMHLKKQPNKKQEEKVSVSLPVVYATAIEHKNLTPYWEIFTSALACYDFFDRKEDANVCL